jgi:FkbM family methyltransferase
MVSPAARARLLRRLALSMIRSAGMARSWLIYHGVPFRAARLARLYAGFCGPGDVCFDIGAHLGSRVRALLQLGGTVIALEPHPGCMRYLRRWYGGHPRVVLIEQAVSATPGLETLMISRMNPSVSTLSSQWLAAVSRAPAFARVRWEEQVAVKSTTLDELIGLYGPPAFCKIDVEGAEHQVLQGLSTPLAALSFEYLPAVIGSALDCIGQLTRLGAYEFNWTIGERPRLCSSEWLAPRAMTACLRKLPPHAGSGDIYCRRTE